MSSDAKYPVTVAPPRASKFSAISPNMSLPAFLTTASVGLGQTPRLLRQGFLNILEAARYWLALASAESVQQWRQMCRPSCLPARGPSPAASSQDQSRWYSHHANAERSPSRAPDFSSSPPTGYTCRPIKALIHQLLSSSEGRRQRVSLSMPSPPARSPTKRRPNSW